MDDEKAGKSCTTLQIRRAFEATPERVFNAWTRTETLKRWWCPEGWLPARIEVDLRVGGSYRLAMCRECDAQCSAAYGRFLVIQPTTKLVYTWNWAGMLPDMPETQVTVEFRAIPHGTEVALRQEPLLIPLCTQHLSGWLAAFSRLAKAFEHQFVDQWN